MSSYEYKTMYEIEGLNSFDEETIMSKDIRIVSREGNLIKLIFDHKSYDALIKDFDLRPRKHG